MTFSDWGNYYPYQTLRNLWMLSKYVPAERLQIEFLNKWRNPLKYGDDPFAPGKYSFDYLFALTMPGQPLAWMEASNLPEEAFSVAPLLEAYKSVSYDFHDGLILPIGEEPSGRSWTGFQSICSDRSGYVLVFREKNPDFESRVRTWLPKGTVVSFKPLSGSGEAFEGVVEDGGMVPFLLPQENSFALYEYLMK